MLRHFRKHGVLSLLFLPPLLYIILVISFTVNIPQGDDYDLFLHYFSHSNEERFYMLFSQHNEHRPVFNRLTAEIMYQFMGSIDFRLLVFVGTIPLMIIFYILYRKFREIHVFLIYFLPVPSLLFFSPLFQNTTWATGALQNYYVLFFSFLSLIFFKKKSYSSFILSVLFAMVGTFTSGSGLLIVIVLILWSIQNILESQLYPITNGGHFFVSKISKHIIRLIVISIIFLLLCYIYFHNYVRPTHHPSVLDWFLYPLRSLQYFFVFLGSYFFIHTIAALFAGIISIALFVYLTFKKYNYKDPVIYYSILFLLGNGAVATIMRSGFGIEQALSSRYVIISILTIIYLYFAMLETININQHLIKWQNFIFALIFIVGMISFIVQANWLAKLKNKLILGMNEWKTAEVILAYPESSRAKILIKIAIEKGYYIPPDTTLK